VSIRSIAVGLAALVAGVSFAAPAAARQGAEPTRPDQVVQWNTTLLEVLQTPGAQPATVHPTRSLAIVHLAILDAVSAAPRSASPDAAAAAAAHTAMASLFPGQRAVIDARLGDSLSQLGGGPRVRRGVRVGEAAAERLLARRADDGSGATPPPFTPGQGPGEYQLTPPNFQQPIFTHWAAVRPFVLGSGDRFRPPPPPAPTSARYATDFDEVKSLGRIDSSARNADQTEIGRFWGAANVPIVFNRIAQDASRAFRGGLARNARLFAVLNVAQADAVIALYDAKYAYRHWRPITAIRAADDDGNPATTGDPAWTPLSNTAPDPSYPGGHAEISQAAAAALRNVLGTDRLDVSVTTSGLPGVERTFQSFSQVADEAAMSRIYAGQHYRYDEDAGQALGDQVGDFVSVALLRSCRHRW
jgi:hypothetical protein